MPVLWHTWWPRLSKNALREEILLFKNFFPAGPHLKWISRTGYCGNVRKDTVLECPPDPSPRTALPFNYSSPTHLQLANVKPLALCLYYTAIQYLPVDVSLTTRRSLRCINGGANTIFIVPCSWWLRGCWLQGLWGSLHCKWYLCYSWACCGCVWCDWMR